MKRIFILLSAALVAFSCNKVVENQPNIDETPAVKSDVQDLTLKFDESLTKASLEIDGSTATLNWKAGDVIGIKLSDDSVISGTVAIDGDLAKVTVDLGGKTVSDVWFPYNSGVKPDAVAQYQSFDTINVPLEMSSIDGTTVTLSSIVDWCLVRVPIKNGPVGSVKAIKQVKLKSNVAGRPAYEINKNLTLSTSEAETFDFVLPVDNGAKLEVIVVEGAGSYNKEYRRKRSSNLDLVAGKTYALPTIEIDDTGKHLWVFGSEADNTSESPLVYWGQWHRWMQLDKIVAKDGYATVETHPANTDHDTKKQSFRADIGPIYNFNYSTNGSTRLTTSDGTVYLDVHTGNYPIFAVKMTNPNNLGDTKRNFCLMVTEIEKAFDSKKMFNADNKQSYLSPSTSSTDGTVILYFDLSSDAAVIGDTGSAMRNTVAYKLQRFNIQFADISFSSAQTENPKFDIYWAGFFNNVNDLKNYAGSPWSD